MLITSKGAMPHFSSKFEKLWAITFIMGGKQAMKEGLYEQDEAQDRRHHQ
jgi:hypothetical protein